MDDDAELAGHGRFFRHVQIPSDLAGAYSEFLLRRQRKVSRTAIALGTGTLIALLALDWIVIPDIILLSSAFRFLIALPIAIALFVLLQHRRATLIVQQVGPACLALLYSALACGLIATSQSPLAPMYLTANNIILMFALLILRLPSRLAAALAVLLISIQSTALVFAPFFTLDMFLCLNGISLAVALPALYANWHIQDDQKRQFLSKRGDKARVRALSCQNLLLERLSALDPLTALSNRRSFDHVLSSSIEEARRNSETTAIAVAMIDVDHFKLFNDRYGHTVGDDALRMVALELARISAEDELVARYGGEEFAIVMPNVNPLALEMVGARIRTGIERLQIRHLDNPPAKIVTVSVGISFAKRLDLQQVTPLALVEAADAALYAAKHKGRNRAVVTAWTGSPDDRAPTWANLLARRA